MNHKTKPLNLISDNNINEALEVLDQMLIHGRCYSDLVHFKSRYQQIRRSAMKGLLAPEQVFRETNILVDHLIEFINEIEEREFLNQILLVSPKHKNNADISRQLRLIFPNLVEDHSGVCLKGDFAFVVINDLDTNLSTEEKLDFDGLVGQYLQDYYLVVATTDNKKVVSDNRGKIHAANSLFALPARIREMMDFIRYFKPE